MGVGLIKVMFKFVEREADPVSDEKEVNVGNAELCLRNVTLTNKMVLVYFYNIKKSIYKIKIYHCKGFKIKSKMATLFK